MSIGLTISMLAFALYGLSPNVELTMISPGSLPPRICALVFSIEPRSLTRSISPWTSASVRCSGSAVADSGRS